MSLLRLLMSLRHASRSLVALSAAFAGFAAAPALALSPPPPVTVEFEDETYCQLAGEFHHLRENKMLNYRFVHAEHQRHAGQHFLMYWHPELPDEVYFYALLTETGQWQWKKRAPDAGSLYYSSLASIGAIGQIKALFDPQSLPTLKDGGYFLAGYGLPGGMTSDYLQEMLNAHRYHVVWQYQSAGDEHLFGPSLCSTVDEVQIHDLSRMPTH